MAAVRAGRKEDHGPIPKLGTGRRRMDRHAERRLGVLKKWRGARASELSMDPGVLCPNSALEAIAGRAPQSKEELRELPEVKGWFAREFGAEVAEISQSTAAVQQAPRSGARSEP